MGFGLSLKDLVSGVKESLGFGGHDKIGNTVGQWMNNFTGTTDAFNKSNKAEWEFWNANNAYNSPQAQMQRYIDAGLNPNLIYGSGSASAGNASGSAPSMSAAGSGALSALLNLYNSDARSSRKLIKKQIEQADWNAQNAMNLSLLNGRKANLAYYQEKYAQAEYNTFKKTGKIPESYLKSNWSGELTGLLKGLIQNYLTGG